MDIVRGSSFSGAPLDVFISYARSNLERIRWIVDALQAEGLTVWYDTQIEAGAQFALEIERQIEQAKVMLAVWSEDSVKSLFVLDEASEGRDREILVPVRIDEVRPPMGFRQLHFTDLCNRDGPDCDEWRSVVDAITGRCRRTESAEPAAASGRTLSSDDAQDAIRELLTIYIDQKGGKQTLAAASQVVKRAYPEYCGQNNWFGETKFKDFVVKLDIPGFTIDHTTPGYLVRGEGQSTRSADEALAAAPNDAFIEQIFADTYAPRLQSSEFRVVLDTIFGALGAKDMLRPREDLSIADWNAAVSEVRDRLRERGVHEIGVNRIRPVLFGLRYGGLGRDTATSVGDLVDLYVLELARQCEDAERPLGEGEFARLNAYISGQAADGADG